MNSAFDESYAGRCASFGCSARAYMLKFTDEVEIEKMVDEQVQLLNGNRDLYNIIDDNMMNGDLDIFFIKEHSTIFAWREEFFNQNFPNGSWFTVDFTNDSFPFDPEDEYLRYITIPYQITRYFDRVMALASVKVGEELSWLKQQTYFENNEHLSSVAESKYKWNVLVSDLSNHTIDDLEKLTLCEEVDVGFSEVSHIIAEVYKNGPKKLEEIALKAVLVNCIKSPSESPQLAEVPAVLNRKAIHGFGSVSKGKNTVTDTFNAKGVKRLLEICSRSKQDQFWVSMTDVLILVVVGASVVYLLMMGEKDISHELGGKKAAIMHYYNTVYGMVDDK